MSKSNTNPYQATGKLPHINHISELRALQDHIIVTDMNFSERQLSSGIVLLGDDATTSGIRPRWAKVYAVGPEQKDVAIGQWVLIEHGRWTRGLQVEIDGDEFTVRRIDPSSIILVSDEEPSADDTMSTVVHAEKKSRSTAEDLL